MTFDLTTNYGGLVLKSPIVVGSCPLTAREQTRMAIEASGAGAIVLPSLFEEQVAIWNRDHGRSTSIPAECDSLRRGERHDFELSWHDAPTYLAFVNRSSLQSGIPVIASLNGSCAAMWVDFAQELQEVGACGIELNLGLGDPENFRSAQEIEDCMCMSIAAIERAVDIPVFAKLSPQYTSLGHLARRLQSGVQGLVLFGRQPDIDVCLDSFRLRTVWGLSQQGALIRLIRSLMSTHKMCPSVPIAASGGIANSEDVIKALMAGADVAMVTSVVYREGPDIIRTMLDGLVRFMEQKHFRSIRELRLSRPLEFDAEEDRLAYVAALTKRVDTEREHAGFQAIAAGDRWGHGDLPKPVEPQRSGGIRPTPASDES